MTWIPDPRECENCHGLGIIGCFTSGEVENCLDCGGCGTEYCTHPECVKGV